MARLTPIRANHSRTEKLHKRDFLRIYSRESIRASQHYSRSRIAWQLQGKVKFWSFSGSDLLTCMLLTFCLPTIWSISLKFCRKSSILEADDLSGACYRKPMAPQMLTFSSQLSLQPARPAKEKRNGETQKMGLGRVLRKLGVLEGGLARELQKGSFLGKEEGAAPLPALRPISVALLLVCPPLRQKEVYTPPICNGIRLPFVSQYFCRSIRVRGR